MTCFVCLEGGGVLDACPCAASVHPLCLGLFLERDVRPRCPICCAPFSVGARLAASEAIYLKKKTTENLLSLAAARSTIGLPEEALELLKSVTPEPPLILAYDIETANALLALGRAQEALGILIRTLRVLFRIDEPRQSLFAHALCLTAQAHTRQGEYRFAEGALTVALNIASQGDLSADDCIAIMSSIKKVHEAQGNTGRLVAAQETIYNITKRVEKDPFIVAEAHVEWLLSKMQPGDRALASILAKDIKILRKRSPADELVKRASLALAGLVRPVKRLRRKCHPENM